MHAFIQAHVSLSQVLLGLVFVLFRVMAAMETSELEQILAAAVRDALNAAHIEIKQAAACMGIDRSLLEKQLRCEPARHISLVKLLQLPFAFWLCFSPVLIGIVYRKRMQEISETLQDVRRG